MGFWDWLSGMFGGKEEEEAPPEPLVLGAELKCPHGSDTTFLIVLEESMDINNLPGACVLDCIMFQNVMPFGYCTYAGCSCEEIMELAEQWENEEPQKTLSNGEEIITTKSTLICKTCGAQIKAVTSGQDGIIAGLLMNGAKMLWEMEEKYPGLLDILNEPYASLYLNEGMYQKALCFLEDYVEKYGEVQIQTLYSETSLETYLIRTIIGRLLATCDENNESDVLNVLYVRGSTNGMYDVAGWYPDLLNKEMIEMLKKDCADTAERIEAKTFYRWQEENKQHISWYADKSIELAYASLILWGMTAEQIKMYRQEAAAKDEVKYDTPQNVNYDSKQVGKKWGKHRADYPELKNYNDYINYAKDIFKNPDKIVYDATNNEYLYIKENQLLRLGENGDFISLYPGANSARVSDAIENGGTIWP